MHFKEKQFFKQIWLWTLLFILMATSVLPTLNTALTDPIKVLVYLFPTLFIMILFFVMNLKTIINQEYISIQFFPFIRKPRSFIWEDITKLELTKYNPLSDYGGWGIRGVSKNRAYNIQGNIGLKIYFKNGNTLMIGTQKPDEINNIVSKICKEQKIVFHNSLTK